MLHGLARAVSSTPLLPRIEPASQFARVLAPALAEQFFDDLLSIVLDRAQMSDVTKALSIKLVNRLEPRQRAANQPPKVEILMPPNRAVPKWMRSDACDGSEHA